MAKYKVVALSVGAMSNKIFRSGEVVEDTAFPIGHAEHLVNEGFLKPYEPELEKTPAGDLPAGEDVKPETPAPSVGTGKDVYEKAKGAKTPTKK